MSQHAAEQGFTCTECGKTYKHKQKLTKHMKSHTDGSVAQSPPSGKYTVAVSLMHYLVVIIVCIEVDLSLSIN